MIIDNSFWFGIILLYTMALGGIPLYSLECYHGTSSMAAEHILEGNCFLPSKSDDSLRLGVGVYFFVKCSEANLAKKCAKAFCLNKLRKETSQGKDYAVIKCLVTCADDQMLDLFNPECLEAFHTMRYATYSKLCEAEPNFQYRDANQADTMVIDKLRSISNIAVVQCPQYFGLLSLEEQIKVGGRHPYKKTNVPNVIMVCADPTKAIIRDIQLVERGTLYNDEFSSIIR